MQQWSQSEQPWSREMLAPFLEALLAGRPLLIVSNREPWSHSHRAEGDSLRIERPASGLVSALEPLALAAGGTWIAHGAGDADRLVVDGRDGVAVPPRHPSYRLRRLWLNEAEVEGYYRQLSNRGLWPLCHQAFVMPEFEPEHWRMYRQVNERFAEAILEEAEGQDAVVFLQDYHLALVPRLLRLARPELTLAQFWHVPWPHPERLRACPYSAELIEGLLGNDLLGFQTVRHCHHFLEAVEQLQQEGGRQPLRDHHVSRIGSFPISIDYEAWSEAAGQPAALRAIGAWQEELAVQGCPLGIGIDRLDYTKGLPQRLRAVDHLLKQQPRWRGQFCFVQLLAPPRDGIDTYRDLRLELEQLVARINDRWRQGEWQPLRLLHQQRQPHELLALHRLADFCVVSSLDDGMNLVAKEFVASRCDGDGVLILSRCTGSAAELEGALLVNPFSPSELALAMDHALTMEEPLRRRRMAQMRSRVREHNVYHWGATILAEAVQSRSAVTPLQERMAALPDFPLAMAQD